MADADGLIKGVGIDAESPISRGRIEVSDDRVGRADLPVGVELDRLHREARVDGK